MKIDRFIRAALVGLTLSVSTYAVTAPSAVLADNLRVVKSGTSTRLQVPLNRAVVVESDTPFAELSIANPGIVDLSSLSDRTIYVLGKSPGTTTLTLFDASGRLITNVEVQVTPDLSEFKERLKQILPGERIEVRSANDGIVLSGVVTSIQKLDRALELAERYAPERVSNLMSVGGIQQVMLKVRFAEMQRSVSKSLSSSLALSGGIGSDLGVRAGTGGLVSSSSDAIAGTLPSGNSNSGAILFGFNAGSTQVGILLEALEQKGVVRFLAEPNLVALSGQEAKFLAGGEYPIPVRTEDGTTIQFKPFGVELGFIPRRETSTTVEMRDGESFAIAGLLQDDFTDSSSQLPWIGDVPVLGALFRSASYQRSQTELVIIITAHLVTPTRGEALALPTDRIKPPTEQDLFLFGRTAAGTRTPNKGAAGEVAKQDFTGSYGYVLD
mgnify:CR=1 FL=1